VKSPRLILGGQAGDIALISIFKILRPSTIANFRQPNYTPRDCSDNTKKENY